MKPKSSITKNFGKKIADERKKLGLSQEELAHRSGLHRTYIGAVERGERNITLVNAECIALALNLELKAMF